VASHPDRPRARLAGRRHRRFTRLLPDAERTDGMAVFGVIHLRKGKGEGKRKLLSMGLFLLPFPFLVVPHKSGTGYNPPGRGLQFPGKYEALACREARSRAMLSRKTTS